ncbi:MAG: adenylyltransferase/cytidyltransferase family protein [Gammaproteobacteria bacterium]|nr:adenylyltransferase/cytidyltransferase family protein [Gammaproteobacteria bacterium]
MILDYRDRGKIGFTCSTFDLLHAGHITMLEEARRQCDFLVVGLQNDPTMDRPDTKNSPVQSLVERQIQLSAVKYVDEIIVYNTEQDLRDLLLTLPINVRILGVEYENTEFTGKEICKNRDIDCFFNKRDHSFSSTSLRKRISELNGN